LSPSKGRPRRLLGTTNKDLCKLLNYNPKRKEFDEDEKEEVIGELNFDIPNYSVIVDSKSYEGSNKKEHKRRGRQPKEKEQDLPIQPKRKMGAIKYYNSVLDKRMRNHRIITEWGVLDSDINYMEKIIRENSDEREFVNTMKIFARFISPPNYVNLMNSLLLEKNIRALIQFLKDGKRSGKININEIETMMSKPIFKLLKDKFSYGYCSDFEQSDTESQEKNTHKADRLKHRIETTKEQLQRANLRPRQGFGVSQVIPSLKSYNFLNENERLLVEKLSIFPESYLAIKKKIIEMQSLEGRLDPPNSQSSIHQGFWYSLEKYVKTYPENAQINRFNVVCYIGIHHLQNMQKLFQ